jgi:hypothetical protein
MHRLAESLIWMLVTAFRFVAIAVAIMLFVFPAYKGVWAGYLPLLLAAILLRGGEGFYNLIQSGLQSFSEARYYVLLLILSVGIQFALILIFRPEPASDGFFVYREACRLLETGGMDPLTYYAPAQIWYYALFFKLFGSSFLTAQLCQLPLAALIPLLGYIIARRVTPTRQARWAGLCIGIYPGLNAYILVTPYYFYMYTVAILFVVWAWVRILARADDWISAAWGGLAAGWGALTKATLLVAPVQTLFLWMLASGCTNYRKRWIAWLIFSIMMASVVAPWTIRNKQVFGETVLVNTAGPLVFYSSNNPESNGLYSSIPDETPVRTSDEMLAHMASCNKRAWAFIREQPVKFTRLVLLKLLHTWGTETSFVEFINWHGAPLGTLDPAMRLVIQIGWATLVLAWCFRATAALWQRLPPSVLEIATSIVVLSKIIIYSIYEGGARHHMPAIPLLIVCVISLTKQRKK